MPRQPPVMQTADPTPSPKRRRNAGTIILGFLALLVTSGIAWVVSIYTASPNIAIPSRPPAPNPNGFESLKMAGKKAVRKDDVGDAIARTPKKKWTLEQKRDLVRANSAALGAARSALRLPYTEVNRYVSATIPFPHYADFRNLARLFMLSGNVAWAGGDRRDAADEYLNAVTVGRRLPHRTILIGALVGLACEAIGRRPLWDHVDQMDAETATHCLHRLNALQAELLPFAATLEEESYTAQHTIVESYEHPELLTDPDESEDRQDETYGNVFLYTKIVPRRVVLDALREYMDQLIAQAKRPYPISKTAPPLPKETLAASLVPVYTDARAKFVGNEAGDALLRTALALRIYRLRTGAYPANLPILVTAKILPAVPDDPFALPGKPLRYRLLSSEKYLLYSIGPDSVDDKGKGIEGKNDAGKTVRTVDVAVKGDMVAGWYTY
ncbi:MAG: hypothetical protein H8F28_22225 [Fibrella sp.]|nr:hypothetical protein [Armatimonadota bacterium]